MPTILSIETATKSCSVAITKDDKVLSVVEEVGDGYSHAENLSVFIDDALKEINLTYSDLDAIAISKGPGSYTGLRIGTSTAKGLCFALDIPLISVSTLQAMAFGVIQTNNFDNTTLLCPMIDARRMEVYSAFFDAENNFIRETKADIIGENSYVEFLAKSKILFFGDGAEKCKEALCSNQNTLFLDNFHPSARHMTTLAEQKFIAKQFEDTAYFEPFYLKDFVAGKPKKLI